MAALWVEIVLNPGGEYWATRSLVGTAYTFACSTLLTLFVRTFALTHSLAHLLILDLLRKCGFFYVPESLEP